MRINILTARFGGPFTWGKDLTYMLNDRCIEAKHIHTLFALSKSCLRQDVDIVHTTVPFPFRLWKKPVVLSMRGDYTIERSIWNRFVPKTIAQADVITTPSQYLRLKLDLGKAIVIPNAVVPQGFTLSQHGARDELNLVTIANFYFPDKVRGLLSVIGILNKVQSHHFSYTVIGGGPYLGTIRRQISGTWVNIRFTGFLPDPRPALAASDIFLYYSYHDNFPNVILEAMACGLPVITNNVGAVSEMIDNGENGYIAETDEHYLQYLLNLLDSPDLRQKIGLKARQTVEQKFNWEKVIGRYIEIYKSIAAV